MSTPHVVVLTCVCLVAGGAGYWAGDGDPLHLRSGPDAETEGSHVVYVKPTNQPYDRNATFQQWRRLCADLLYLDPNEYDFKPKSRKIAQKIKALNSREIRDALFAQDEYLHAHHQANPDADLVCASMVPIQMYAE